MKNDQLDFRIITNADGHLIKQVAKWYHQEWAISEAKTAELIGNLEHEAFHAILYMNGEPVATGGIHHKVSILNVDPSLSFYTHWLAIIFVRPQFRGQGIGSTLCIALEQQAWERKMRKLHLFTHTAESFYSNQKWKVIKRMIYQERNIAIMEKNIDQ